MSQKLKFYVRREWGFTFVKEAKTTVNLNGEWVVRDEDGDVVDVSKGLAHIKFRYANHDLVIFGEEE
jgi:hypothetical protein